jgi:formylmethanofuran dehydrogenase subunit B
MAAARALPSDISDVTCPFCGLACDDLVVAAGPDGVAVRANGCHLAVAGFESSAPREAAAPRIGGRTATLAEAAAEAARLLRQARQPLIAGMATDVAGARAAARLADRIGAVVDHMNSTATLRNLLVLQDGGWITTTLSEVRNRADLVLLAGNGPVRRFPRFWERCLANRETMFGAERKCEVIVLGQGLQEGTVLPGPAPEFLACDFDRLHEAFGALRALVAGRTLLAGEAAGRPLQVWRELAERMRQARYGVLVWAAADLEGAHGELTVQAACELIKDLNQHTRFAGLPLGGSDGDVTADSVLLWQTGFATRTAFGRGHPEHDPHHYAAARMLERGEADVLLWVSSFTTTRAPEPAAAPTVVLGRAGMQFDREPEVYIPVGTPGLDHPGHLFRTDRVVVLSLRQLRPATVPSVAEAIAAIEAAL